MVDELLGDEPGDGNHGQAAVVQLLGLQGKGLVIDAPEHARGISGGGFTSVSVRGVVRSCFGIT